MKKSAYNIIQQIDDSHYVIFNSISGIIKMLTNEQYQDYTNGQYLYFSPFYVDDDTNEMQNVRQRRESYINKKKDYIRFTILPTFECNANCAFCFENTYSRKTMSKAEVEQTILFIKSQAIKYKKLRIHWFGGEPMVALPIMYRITSELLEFCAYHDISYKACIGTNLSLINENNYLSIIRDLHIDTIEFAFDGNGSHHNFTKNYRNKNFDAFNHNLRMLDILVKNNITTIVRLNSTKANIDELLQLSDTLCYKYYKYNNFKIYLAVIVSTDLYKENNNLIFPTEYSKHYLQFFHILQQHGAGMEVYPLNQNANFCYGTNPNSIVIGSDGTLTKCVASPSLKSQAIGDIWSGVKKDTVYQRWIHYNVIDECYKCPLFPQCLGGCINDLLCKSISPCKKEKYYLNELLVDIGNYMISHDIDEYIFR